MLTTAQQEAIAVDGDVLVMAGAGTGKTHTLVERCVERLLCGKCSLEEILVVTFTEAAATEMRHRIRARLEAESKIRPADTHLAEQIALLDTAHISTLHSFCLQLVRRNFHVLGIDPQIVVLDEGEARLLADEALGEVLREHYAARPGFSTDVLNLIQQYGRGSELPVRKLILRLHHYLQTLPDPKHWLEGQLAMFNQSEANQWRSWLLEALPSWRNLWLSVLRNQPRENTKALACASILSNLTNRETRENVAERLQELAQIDAQWPKRKQPLYRKLLKPFFEEVEFLHSLVAKSGANDPLMEDWSWVRSEMITLLLLAQEFGEHFASAKRELGVVDFHDLEQFALRLLWNAETGGSTAIAQQWRGKLRFVFVDEYQDINSAQDKIIEALSRDGAAANRFLVGDVKQSIYRFRLADPRIFQNYARDWSQPESPARTIPLTDNYRSREGILNFINSLFSSLMREEMGGVRYDEDAWLRFGDSEGRLPFRVAAGASPKVELHLRLKGKVDSLSNDGNEEENGSSMGTAFADLAEAEKEARLIGLRLREFREHKYTVWDDKLRQFRPAGWRDMVVLLRSPANKAESFAKEFSRLGIPLQVSRGGFYDSTEVTDLLSLLILLDNPMQDVPTLAVLRSPFVGLSLDELAAVRLADGKGNFWKAVRRFHHAERNHPSWSRVHRFLEHYSRWRRLAREASLSQCLETVLSETHYEAWLLTQARGDQRHANVQRLLMLTRQFDQFRRHGLLRFLRFIEAQRDAAIDEEPATIEAEDAVRLMSIHQSKGLEFPVVVVADLGKAFNFVDQRDDIILDEKYGLCPQVKPPETEQRYPSLAHWLAARRQKQEALGEELRLLYVALTRARDVLVLVGSVASKTFREKWPEQFAEGLSTQQLLSAHCYLDWLAGWLAEDSRSAMTSGEGQTERLKWKVYDDSQDSLARASRTESEFQPVAEKSVSDQVTLAANKVDPQAIENLRETLQWEYPFQAATREPAKTSVSALRRRVPAEAEEEAQVAKFAVSQSSFARHDPVAGALTAVEIGTAHHRFLQFFDFTKPAERHVFLAEATRLEKARVLSAAEREALDVPALCAFWKSEVGQRIRGQAANVHRELEFTARFSPEDLRAIELYPNAGAMGEEFVVVQGVVDLAVILP
ncbi:MAG: helicase-exonuclease AddAB subunit AddA, partial [Verrucomicrobiota bacterium]